ncbi:MAG TPA: maleylacetoacetate isomerase, partial [Burkholderiaceae bacterium]|nr:maleylacetoacetate isomerase [Burkholderiaceae bacterium]
INVGLTSVEALLAGNPATGRYCHGDQVTLADVVLVPQVFNARRYDCDLSAMPTIVRIADTCAQIEAFARAEPARQPDAEA